MPPWKPVPGVGPPLRHDRTLLASEIQTLRAWATAGAPEGPPSTDPSDSTATLPSQEWPLGPPDLVVEMDQPFQVPASGDDLYRCFVLPTDLPKDRYLTAIDVKPGNPRVVHHTFGYVDTRGLGRQRATPAIRCPVTLVSRASPAIRSSVSSEVGLPATTSTPSARGSAWNSPKRRRRDAGSLSPQRQARDRPHPARPLPLKNPRSPALEWVSACPDVGNSASRPMIPKSRSSPT